MKLNASYVGERRDIQRLVPKTASRILDIGCSNGALGAELKKSHRATVHGIEFSPEMAAMAAESLDQVHVGDATAIVAGDTLDGETYDAIICADLLEHLIDPWTTLRDARQYLAPGGIVITSIPNIRHISTISNLVFRGLWPHRDRGIHDRTHVRFFTRRSVTELFADADLTIESLRANYRFFDKPTKVNRLARLGSVPGLREFLAYQYLVVARDHALDQPMPAIDEVPRAAA